MAIMELDPAFKTAFRKISLTKRADNPVKLRL
jgi:hypothetical protein